PTASWPSATRRRSLPQPAPAPRFWQVDERLWWRQRLGAAPDPAGRWELAGPAPVRVPGWRTEQVDLLSFGARLTCAVLRPGGSDSAGPVVIVPFYEVETLLGLPCARTAHRPDRQEQAYALHLAAHGL